MKRCDSVSNILARLRECANIPRDYEDDTAGVLLAAASEIERLRTALRQIATRGTGIGAAVCVSTETLRAIAKLALEGR